MRVTRVEALLLSAILVFSVVVRLALIDRPFHRDPEGCGSFYGLLARNYWRYDVRQTLGVPVMSMGIAEKPTFYPNHPPLVPLLIAGALGLAGYRDYSGAFPPDWLIRAPTIPFTIGCIILIWWIARGASRRAGLIAACLFASVPMTLVFGGLVDVIGTQLVFFILLSVLAYLRFHERPTARRLAVLVLAFAPAALTDWPAFFLVPVLGAHFILTRPRREWGWVFAFGGISVALFAIPYVQVVLVTDNWAWMGRILHRRALSSVSDAHAAFTLSDWIRGALLKHAIGRHTWPVMIGAAAWILLRVFRPLGIRSQTSTATALLLAWATLHIIVGRQGVFVHEWWWWPLTPAVALAAALFIDRVLRSFETPRSRLLLNAACAACLLLFVVWNARAAFRELHGWHGIVRGNPSLDYTIVELGEVIRRFTPPNQVVMLADSDVSLSLWYYTDRPLRYRSPFPGADLGVWDAATFEALLNADSSDLCFDVTERFPAPAATFVLPRGYLDSGLQPFSDYLQSRYRLHETEKFLVFDLISAN